MTIKWVQRDPLVMNGEPFCYGSRLTVRQGPALIQLVNYGEDEHDLYVHRIGGTRTFRVRRILPGERATLSIRLLPGRYRLWCAVSDHRARGMRATLRVRR